MLTKQSFINLMDEFKPIFKYFKRRDPPPDYDDVLDFEGHGMSEGSVSTVDPQVYNFEKLGLIEPSKWKIVKHSSLQGITIILNPFTPNGQQMWVKRCMSDYTSNSNISNLSAFYSKDQLTDLWNGGDGMQNKDSLLYRLRWVTLGYHHNWTTKVYSESNVGDFPPCLRSLVTCIASCMRYNKFKPEAAIVNYYHNDSTLSAHTDHSEPNTSAPLFSLSFGLPAIFLVGGETKSVAPKALWLRSGDVLIMSEQARLAYHAVPRICKVSADLLRSRFFLDGNFSSSSAASQTESQGDSCSISPNHRLTSPRDDISKPAKISKLEHGTSDVMNDDFSPFWRYVCNNRINVNVRQVLFDGQLSLTDEPNTAITL